MSDQISNETTQTKPAVLLIGCSHWDNPGRDVFNVQHDDMLTPHRQREIQECIDLLACFQPTKVAVETRTEQSDALNERYRQYLAGTFQLTANERQQLGFRIAAACQHEQIYAIDWNEAIGYEHDMEVVFDFAREHQPDIYEQYMSIGQKRLEEANAKIAQTKIRDLLLDRNDPVNLANDHRIYLTMARIGEGKQYVGIGWVQGWYGRNLRIFVNLTRIVTLPQDRIMVVYGAGHVPLLSQFIRDSGLFTLETVASYLAV